MSNKKIVGPHLREVLIGSSIALIIKVFAAGSAFIMSAVVARKLGADEAGLFFLAMTVVSISAAIGRMGLDNSVVRFIAGAQAEGNNEEVHAVSNKALKWTFLLCLTIALLVWTFRDYFAQVVFDMPKLSPILAIAAAAVPLVGVYTLYASTLRGIRKVAQSVVTLNVTMPFSLLLGVLLVRPSTALEVTGLYVSGCALSMILGYLWWRSERPPSRKKLIFPSNVLWTSCAPLWSVVILQQLVMWSSQLLLGVWSDSDSVAMFSAAQRTATLISFVLVAVNTVVAPKFAAMYRQRDIEGLRYVTKWSLRLMMFAATPALALMWIFPEWILGFFGPEFKQASGALMILAVGQFINVASGSVGFLLSMTGHERALRQNACIGAILGLIAGAALIPSFGLIGGAIATALATASQNILGVFQVKKKIGINTLSI